MSDFCDTGIEFITPGVTRTKWPDILHASVSFRIERGQVDPLYAVNGIAFL